MLLAAGAIDAALAQGSPFGVGPPKSAPPRDARTGIVGWIMVKQAEFYKGLSGAIRAAKTDWSALWVLFGLSFAYGVFHAAGPGHGKAVISSYVVANGETWWRGVVLSFASAMVQAAVAVAIVGIAAVLLNATAATMSDGRVLDRDRQLRADHRDRPAAGLGEGPRRVRDAGATCASRRPSAPRRRRRICTIITIMRIMVTPITTTRMHHDHGITMITPRSCRARASRPRAS